jgi:hypothetical protein
MGITREEIIWAYRCILGREPESELVIEGATSYPNFSSLRRAMIDSAEFQALEGSGAAHNTTLLKLSARR